MTQIKLRRDTSANFASANPVLGVGEPAYETDTKKLKIGDGTTAYTQLEYFSAGGGGSTNITATLPLKIVDGVISLEVDGQTIQIVDGKLHANIDELGNEVNSLTGEVTDLSGRVTAAEADILTKENKITTTGALSLQEKIISNLTNMTETETQITPNETQYFTVAQSEFYFSNQTYNAPKCYIAIPYQFGQWLKIPGGYNTQPSVFFGHFLEDGDFLITAVFSGNCYERNYPIYGGIVRGTAPVSFSTYSGTFYLNSYGQVSEKAMESNVKFTETDPCAYLQLIDNTSSNNIICGSYNYGYGPNSSGVKGYAETHVVYNRDLTNYTVQDFVRDTTTALIMSPSANYPILKSAVGLYAATGRLGWNQDGYNQLKASLGENLFDLTKSQVNNYLELNLGSGLSVVDGKLTASGLTELPIASTTALGGIKVGDNLSITADGTLSATGGGSTPANMVTTDTSQDITGEKSFTTGKTTFKNRDSNRKVIGEIHDNGYYCHYYTDKTSGEKPCYLGKVAQNTFNMGIPGVTRVTGRIFAKTLTKWDGTDEIGTILDSSNLGSFVDGTTITFTNNKLSATGGGSVPTNMVTTDTAQTITGLKTFGGTDLSKIALEGSKSLISFRQNSDSLPTTLIGGFFDSNGKKSISIGSTDHETLSLNAKSVQDASGNKFLTSGNVTASNDITITDTTDGIQISATGAASMPSDRYIDLTLGANGSTYTAPANGWLCLARQTNNSNQYVQFNATSSDLGYRNNILTGQEVYNKGAIACACMPMLKGQSTVIYYSAGGTIHVFRFVYAGGEQ